MAALASPALSEFSSQLRLAQFLLGGTIVEHHPDYDERVSSKYLKSLVCILSIGLTVGTMPSAVSAAAVNQSCKKAGAMSTAKSKGKNVKVKCSKVGKKLRWVQVKTPTTTTVSLGTVSQRNAAAKGSSYLRTSAFSRSGLISQLEFEGFSLEDATFGADAQKADWKAQAVKKAASYLKTSAFSRTGLISQMEFEGFSDAEAVHGVDAQSADWNSQAAKKAASYLKTSAFSRSGLIDQLLFEGFTQSEANYGVSSTGL